MRRFLKSVGVCVLTLAIALTTNISASAYGGTGGANNPPNHTGTSGSGFASSEGYGFRVYLYDVGDEDVKSNSKVLWGYNEKFAKPYKSKSAISNTLDSAARSSAIYLGVSKNSTVYDRHSRSYVSISKKRILTDAQFNKNRMPGVKKFSSVNANNRKKTNWGYYSGIFNGLTKMTDSDGGMKKIIKWFGKHGVSVKSFKPENTLVVVEPVARYKNKGKKYLLTYQDARKNKNTQSGCFSFYQCAVYFTGDGSNRFIPKKQGQLISSVVAYMGGFYQSWVMKNGDCRTQAYDSSSGYGYYGAKKIIQNRSKVATNVAVVYSGAVGTSDASKIKTYDVLSLNNDFRTYKIKNGASSGRWKEAKTDAEQLGLGKTSDLNDYSIIMAGTYSYWAKKSRHYKNISKALKVSDLQFKWGETPASGGTYNLGSSYRISGVARKGKDFVRSTVPIAQAVNTKLKYRRSIKSTRTISKIPDNSVKYAKNMLGDAFDTSSGDFTEKSGVKAKSILGLSVELLIKAEKIKSHVVTIKTDLNGSVKSSSVTRNYRSTDLFGTKVGSNVRYAIAVPNYDGKSYSDGNVSALKSACTGSDYSSVLSGFKGYFDGSAKLIDTPIEDGDSISMGTEVKDGKAYGYTVYLLEVKVPDVLVENGQLELKDYEINYVFPSMTEEAFKIANYVTLNKNLWTIDPFKPAPVNVGFGFKIYSTKKYYDIVVTESGSSGKTISKDDELDSDKMLLYNKGLVNFDTRKNLLAGRTFKTDDGVNYTVDYAFNLSRGVFGDRRTVSSIAPQTIKKEFAQKVLDLDYGDTPKTVRQASTTRDSSATVGDKLTDTFKFGSVYKRTGQDIKYSITPATYHHSHSKGGYCIVHYHKLIKTPNSPLAFNVNGLSVPRVNLSITSIARKYSTDDNEDGKCDVSDKASSLRQAEKSIDMAEEIHDQKGYSVAFTKNSDITLSFYPEVAMKAYEYSGDNVKSRNDVIEKKVVTVGEKERHAKSSSLYIFNIKKAESGKDLTGITYSDTAVGGSDASKISDKVALTAGGDFGVSIKKSNFKVNLYGYSLDVINKSKDENMLVREDDDSSSKVVIPYTDIINDGSDVYSDWGNSSSSSELLNDFTGWVKNMLDVKNYGVDLNMDLDTKKARSATNVVNFNATIGGFGGYDVSESGVYPLSIKHGQIEKDVYYKYLINQIASDYDCDEEDAVKVFENSGLYTSVLNAIESDNSTINKSQSDENGVLGSSSHWYDEEVRTIVVRRYKADGISIKNITANDKLDLGDAVTSGSSDKKYDGKFGLTMYFSKKFTGISPITIYNPAVKATKNGAIDSGDVIINNLHINDADFVVTSRTTDDMDW